MVWLGSYRISPGTPFGLMAINLYSHMLNQGYCWAPWWQLAVELLGTITVRVEFGFAGTEMEGSQMFSDSCCGTAWWWDTMGEIRKETRESWCTGKKWNWVYPNTYHLWLYKLALMTHKNSLSLHYDDRNIFFLIFPWELILSHISINIPS